MAVAGWLQAVLNTGAQADSVLATAQALAVEDA